MKGFENKEFVFKIEYIVDFDDLMENGIESMLEELRQTGSAEILDVELRSKPDARK